MANLSSCVIIGVVRFWQVFVVDIERNLTGTSLMTFMLCTIELMLAGICINIPMLRPFYLRWRQKSKASQTGSSNVITNGTRPRYMGSTKSKGQTEHGTWIELVCCETLSLPFHFLYDIRPRPPPYCYETSDDES